MSAKLLPFDTGFVTDEDVKRREAKLRNALHSDGQFRVKEDASVEVAQVGLEQLVMSKF